MNLIAGTRLQAGRYTLEQELGSGGLGIIFRATYHALQRTVVIKTLHQSLDQHPQLEDFKLKFQDEARRLAACTHPNIVRFHDFFIEDDCPFLVMDYIPGQTLAEKVVSNRSPLPEATAIDYTRQIASALEVVHHLGMLHRDIKPGNIMVRENSDQVVLIDFGIAREFSGLPQTHTRMISEGYAPIEQYLIKSKRTPATDVYGLAATLYTLLTAKVPVASILRDREPMPSPRDYQSHLSQAVDRAVMQGMALEIHDRPQSITEWLALLPGSKTKLTSESKTIQQILTIQQSDPLLVLRRSTLQRTVGVGLGMLTMLVILSGWASSFQSASTPNALSSAPTPSSKPLPQPSKAKSLTEMPRMSPGKTPSTPPLVKTIALADGRTYRGELVKGRPRGEGKLNYKNNISCEADFPTNLSNGQGVCKTVNGNFYEGNFKNDLFRGQSKQSDKGILLYPNSTYCIADLSNGKFSGQGFCRIANGDFYEGNFKNDEYEGHGKAIYANKSIYIGGFSKGKWHGKGEFTDVNGQPPIKGEWKNGERIK
jgi:serine/threonine protein kinase